MIDDLSMSGVNSCVTAFESPLLRTVDVAAAVLAMWLSLCDAKFLDPTLKARAFDLSSAYKQVGLSETGRQFSYIGVYDPVDKRTKFFFATVLPFGAVKSVHSFLRLARAVWWVGVLGCKLTWTSFYDDFILFSKPSLCKSAEQLATCLFKVTGWVFAESGRKFVPFDDSCEASTCVAVASPFAKLPILNGGSQKCLPKLNPY